VTEVKDFHEVLIFADTVINKNGAMLQFSYAEPFSNRATHSGEPAQQIHTVEQSAAKTTGGLAVILGNIADYFSEIA
jgi:hypothetical protein